MTFSDLWKGLLEWMQYYDTLLWWIATTSLGMFVFSLIVIPWLMVRIPPDYFTRRIPVTSKLVSKHPFAGSILLILKNLTGVIFILAGIFMLIFPGQGILTILIGIFLLSFPGKHRLIRRIVAQGPILRTVNKLRKRAGRLPIEHP